MDQANILSPVTKADLERKLADLEQKSRIQLVVATVPSLDGEEIEPYANELFRAWKLGEAKENNGALLLIAPKERRVRIEVGYGLEGTLTDAVSSIIISNAIAPRFKAGDFNGGVTRGVDDIITTLTTDSAEWKPKPTDMRAEHEASLLDTLAPFLIFLFIMFVISRISRRGGGGNVIFIPMGTGGFSGGGGFGGGGGLWRRRRVWRRRRLFWRRRVFRRRRRLGRLVMILDAEAAARVEAAFDATQLETRAPLVCVLAGASTSLDGEFLLGACILALLTPLPLLLFTELSAHRIYVAQLLVAILAGCCSRCRRCGGGLFRSALCVRRATGRRWRNSSCAGSIARGAARSSMCRWPSITSALFQLRTRRASSLRRNGRPPSMRRSDRSPLERRRPRSLGSRQAAATFSRRTSRLARPWTRRSNGSTSFERSRNLRWSRLGLFLAPGSRQNATLNVAAA